jgi:hypothetical protein
MVKYDVAYGAPTRIGFSIVEESHAVHLPQSNQPYTSRMIHGAIIQDLAMGMDQGQINVASPEGRRRDGGCLRTK